MTRHPSSKVAHRKEAIVQRIRAVKADHPFWGYRRLWAHLRFGEGLLVNKKPLLRLMRAHDLLVKPKPPVEGHAVSPAEQAAADGAESVVGH